MIPDTTLAPLSSRRGTHTQITRARYPSSLSPIFLNPPEQLSSLGFAPKGLVKGIDAMLEAISN